MNVIENLDGFVGTIDETGIYKHWYLQTASYHLSG
jgi:hypothetical protein